MQYEPGGPVAEGTIPLCIPEIRGNEWRYVKECLDTGWVSSAGRFVDRFENEMAKCVGTRYAVATCSGTAALHIALLVAGVEPEDEVLVSTLTFIAPVNAIRYVGARPILLDADPVYWQMDVEKLADFCEQECCWRDGALRNRATGRRVRAIVPVHILGHPVDMDPLLALARRYGLIVIEDATEALGARYGDRTVGHLGDIACFSFNGNKVITCGGGGMIVTDRDDWAQRARHLTTQAKADPLEYVHDEIGYNYRLSNLQAAVGCAQLEWLSDHVAAKRRIAHTYGAALEGVSGISPMCEAPWASSIFWLYTILVDETQYGMDRRALAKRLQSARIQTRPLWQPAHQSPAHRGVQAYRCEVADRLNRDALSLPCSVGLSREQQSSVLRSVVKG